MMNHGTESNVAPVSTGNTELDMILRGGLTANRVYLIEGNPGAGKTTLALQFLLEGSRLGERGLYISVVKKRSGGHERTIREFGLHSGGIHVGEPLRDFHGVLSGIPTFFGEESDLMRKKKHE